MVTPTQVDSVVTEEVMALDPVDTPKAVTEEAATALATPRVVTVEASAPATPRVATEDPDIPKEDTEVEAVTVVDIPREDMEAVATVEATPRVAMEVVTPRVAMVAMVVTEVKEATAKEDIMVNVEQTNAINLKLS